MRLAPLLAAAALIGAGSAWAGPDALRTEKTAFQSVVVKPGDTLWSISHAFLQDPTKWDEILKYNKLPTADPTVALPGMTLKVPLKLIKVSMRAAKVVFVVNKVLRRPRDTAAWKSANLNDEAYEGDAVRTLEDSKVRVKFLNSELLNLEQNSLAVIKPVDMDADLELKSGSVFAGRARVVTANARVTPKSGDTRYSATVAPDLTTRVEVFKGAAVVAAQGDSVTVPAGMETSVKPGLAPEAPKPLQLSAELEARAQEFASAAKNGGGAAPEPKAPPPTPEPEADAESLRSDIQVLRIGQPIQGFHVQAARDQYFREVLFDKRYEADARFNASEVGLTPGAYWWRVSAIDLLGTEGPFHSPHYYTVGIKRVDPENERLASMVDLISPQNDAEVGESVRVTGILRDERLKLSVNGKPVEVDPDGNFSIQVKTGYGTSSIYLEISDGKGNSTRLSRRVIRL